MTTKKTWLYLEWLRRSGQTNMYGAVPYLMEEFKKELQLITFNDN